MLDEETDTLYWGEEIIELGSVNGKLLGLLINNKDRVVTYDMLCKELYGLENLEKIKYRIPMQIRRLRKKLEGKANIKTVVKVGYILK